jgi:hypothetical protein
VYWLLDRFLSNRFGSKKLSVRVEALAVIQYVSSQEPLASWCMIHNGGNVGKLLPYLLDNDG